jgi:hypothetical protein
MYGKVLKGTLLVDTTDAQYLFDVLGKTPEYVPPVITKASSIIYEHAAEETAKKEATVKKKRNIIRDNIEFVKSAHKM